MKNKKINISILFSGIFILGAIIYARSVMFNPGETLDPDCNPGEINCTVKAAGKFIDGTNTSDAVYVTGNVGIGTSVPGDKLHIKNGDIRLEEDSQNAWTGIKLDGKESGKTVGIMYGGSSANNLVFARYGDNFGSWEESPFWFKLNDGTFYTSGKIGIGTSSPIWKLDINTNNWGSIRMIGNNYKTIGMYSSDKSTKTFILHYGEGNQVRFGRFGANFGSWEANPLNLSMNAPTNSLVLRDNGYIAIGGWSVDEKLHVYGKVKANAFVYSSDKRLKKDIKKLENYRDILKINAVRFNWKKDGKADVGIIAQEVQKYFPEFVHQSGKYLAVDYPKLAVPMINLLQEQESRLDRQEKEIQELKEIIKKMNK